MEGSEGAMRRKTCVSQTDCACVCGDERLVWRVAGARDETGMSAKTNGGVNNGDGQCEEYKFDKQTGTGTLREYREKGGGP